MLLRSVATPSAGDPFEWRCIDRIAVVGRRRGVTIYEPLGRKGEVPEGRLHERDRYQDGLRAYFEARFEEALEIFGALRGSGSKDRAAAVLYDRVSELLHTEVPEGWDGTHAAPFK